MSCHEYEDALLLAAAGNGEPDGKLARHLECCSTCRTTLRSESDLFSRIDRTLRAQINQDPRPGFLPQLRLKLSNEPAAPGSNRVWNVAGAALALLLIAMFYPLVNTRQASVQGNLQMPSAGSPQSAKVTQSGRASEDLGIRPRHHFKARAVQSAGPQELEVLVPPDEREAFVQFVRTWLDAMQWRWQL